jgi:hypothetical protein
MQKNLVPAGSDELRNDHGDVAIGMGMLRHAKSFDDCVTSGFHRIGDATLAWIPMQGKTGGPVTLTTNKQ